MASYVYNISGTYNLNGSSFDALGGATEQSGTLSDIGGTSPGVFDVNEQINWDPDGFTGGTINVAGNISLGGETFLIVGPNPLVNGDQYRIFGNVDDPGAFVANFGNSNIPQGNFSDSESFITCFAAGTLIATPGGERAVQTLRPGDPVLTADGRAVPVKWIGRQTVQKLFAGERSRPVRVAGGALGGGLPHTDLVLTADHALILDGLAINAGALVNGTTITFDPAPERATYYHVETERHEVIVANGAPAESYIDYVARRAFDNYDEYVALDGDDATITEMDLPRISSARLVPASIRARLGEAASAA